MIKGIGRDKSFGDSLRSPVQPSREDCQDGWSRDIFDSGRSNWDPSCIICEVGTWWLPRNAVLRSALLYGSESQRENSLRPSFTCRALGRSTVERTTTKRESVTRLYQISPKPMREIFFTPYDDRRKS